MRAVVYARYGTPDVLQLKKVAKPVPQANDVLVRIYATTVTPVDCAFRKGDPFISRFFTGLTKPKNPILGSEFSGEVEAVGQQVKRFKKGDQVFGAASSTHAEYVCLAEDGPLVLMPASLSYDEAAAVPYGVLTALPFLRDHGRIQGGQRVLIYGASGSVGSYAVQLAKYFGAHVTGVCSTRNVDLVKSLGADVVIDYTKDDFTKNVQRYDIIFDVVGKLSFSQCKGSLKAAGSYLTPVATPAILPQMLWSSRFSSKKAKFATTGLRPQAEQAADLRFARELLDAGQIKPVIDRCYPFEDIAEAYRYVEAGYKKGNVVISV